MFLPVPETSDASHYTTFRYQFVDAEDESITSQEATVQIAVTPVNDAPLGTSLSNLTATGPTMITLDGQDNDESAGNSTRFYARVSTFPRMGRLFQTNATGSLGALMDGTVTHVANVVVRFSSCAADLFWMKA